MTKRKIFCASLSSCWSEAYKNCDLKQGAYIDLDLPLVSQSSCTNCHVYATFTKYQIMWFPPHLFPSKRRVAAFVLFHLVCCSCWHVRGEQHPSYNSFGSWIRCVVTGCSGLSPHFSISLAELQAAQCQKTNYRRIYPVLGLVGCYSALTGLAVMDWVCSTACGTIFLALQRDFSSYFWTNALC